MNTHTYTYTHLQFARKAKILLKVLQRREQVVHGQVRAAEVPARLRLERDVLDLFGDLEVLFVPPDRV